MAVGDAQEQADEAASLEAIYGDDVEYTSSTSSYKVFLPSRSTTQPAVLRVLLPQDYPSAAGPLMELEAAGVSEQQLAEAVQQLEQIFCPGQVCLFDCIEWLRDQLQEWQDEAAAAAVASSLNELALGSNQPGSSGGSSEAGQWHEDEAWDLEELQHLPEASAADQPGERAGDAGVDAALIEAMRHKITSGEPLTERKSTFQAHVAAVESVDQVKAVVAVLLENNKIQHATHNIMAYRIPVPGRPGVFHQDSDDDGEAAAGGRLLHLLQVADVQGAVVVVSRWFGGVLLGPARFGLINNTARQLLEHTGFIQHSSAAGGGSKQSAKKQHRKKRS